MNVTASLSFALVAFVCGAASAGDMPLEIVERAATVNDTDARIELFRMLDAVAANEVQDIVKLAFRHKSASARMAAAWLLARLDFGGFYDDVFKSLISDESAYVRRLAWLRARIDKAKYDEMAFESSDVQVRAIAALRCEKSTRLLSLRIDSSPFVRAVAIRRLGKLATVEKQQPDLVAALTVTLVDQDQLVRSNAVICAHATQLIPRDIAGVLLDERPIIALEDLLAGEGAEDANLRKRWEIDGEFFPNLFSLRSLLISNTIKILPENQIPRLVLPVGEQDMIGSAAANVLMSKYPGDAARLINAIVRSPPADTALQCQLREVLSTSR